MGKAFDYDGPLMSFLGKLSDIVILNFLTLLCCLPIVTIGVSLTACHYVALKLRRGEGYVWKNFWKSIKVNFVQSTIIWLILVAIIISSCYSYFFTMAAVKGTASMIMSSIVFVGMLFTAMTSMWIFPIQSKFINNIGATIKNSFFLAFKYLFRTMLMLGITAIPFLLIGVLTFNFYWIILLFGFSVPAYLCAMLYDKKFEMIEEVIKEREEQEGAA